MSTGDRSWTVEQGTGEIDDAVLDDVNGGYWTYDGRGTWRWFDDVTGVLLKVTTTPP